MESGFTINKQMLETNMKKLSLVAQRIVYEEVSKEGDILKMNIRKKILFDVKQSYSFAKPKRVKLLRKNVRKKEIEIVKKIKDVPAEKEAALRSASKA